jgi:hypothetical protein
MHKQNVVVATRSKGQQIFWVNLWFRQLISVFPNLLLFVLDPINRLFRSSFSSLVKMASGSAKSSSIAYDRMGPLRAKPASLPASGIFFDSAQPSHLPMMPSMDSSVLDVSSSKNQLPSADDRQQVQTSISSSFFLPSGSLTRSSTNMHHTQYMQDVGFSGNQVENSEKMNRKVTVEKPEVNIKKNENVTYASDVADSIR